MREITTISLEKNTQKRLARFKLEKDFKTFDDAIKFLLKKNEKTKNK